MIIPPEQSQACVFNTMKPAVEKGLSVETGISKQKNDILSYYRI
jgi:hypothetical protein